MTEGRQRPRSGQQISVAVLMSYATLWAVVIFLFRQAARLQEGTYTITEARLSDLLMLAAAGLFCAAIALPVTVLFGRSRHAAPVAFGCFVGGILGILILIVTALVLGSFGVIALD